MNKEKLLCHLHQWFSTFHTKVMLLLNSAINKHDSHNIYMCLCLLWNLLFQFKMQQRMFLTALLCLDLTTAILLATKRLRRMHTVVTDIQI